MQAKVLKPEALRNQTAKGSFSQPTTGFCNGFVQANLVVLDQQYAKDFAAFCKQNPKPCPLLEQVPAGQFHSTYLAKNANLLNEIPKYHIFRDGQLGEVVNDISEFYNENLNFFLLGCSFSFEKSLLDSGINLRHIEEGKNVAMYNTNIKLKEIGIFKGNMVVSMRPIHKSRVSDAVVISAHFPKTHGSPIHIGYPEMIGIKDLSQPDYGDAVVIKDNEIPVFWACGVTPQNVLKAVKIPFAITHAPGHMFVGDLEDKVFYENL